jgi:hypothetical protein
MRSALSLRADGGSGRGYDQRADIEGGGQENAAKRDAESIAVAQECKIPQKGQNRIFGRRVEGLNWRPFFGRTLMPPGGLASKLPISRVQRTPAYDHHD